ncbi:MAG: hypothetical protein AAGA54_08640 [Myxococcota bacterium]
MKTWLWALGLALVGCGPNAADNPPWQDDRLGIVGDTDVFSVVELPSLRATAPPRLPTVWRYDSWRWTLGGEGLALPEPDGFNGYDVLSGSRQGQYIALSHCAPAARLEARGDRLMVIEGSCEGPALWAVLYGFDGEQWLRVQDSGPVEGVEQFIVLRNGDAAFSVVQGLERALVRMGREGPETLGVFNAIYDIAESEDGQLAVATDTGTWIDGREDSLIATALWWRPGHPELAYANEDGSLILTVTLDGSPQPLHAFEEPPLWFGWSPDGQHWMAQVGCDDDESELIVDGDPFVPCGEISTPAWSNTQSVIGYLAREEESGTALHLVDLDGHERALETVSSFRFAPTD